MRVLQDRLLMATERRDPNPAVGDHGAERFSRRDNGEALPKRPGGGVLSFLKVGGVLRSLSVPM